MRAQLLIALVVSAGAACKEMKKFSESDVDRTRVATRKLAFEAYPMWAVDNPTLECPPSIDALLAKVPEVGTSDPWGTPYQMLCGSSLPKGVSGVAVVSFGPDRKEDTDDDVRSWDETPIQ